MILLRIFKNSRSGGILAVFLLSLALLIPELFHPAERMQETGMPLFTFIFGWLYRFPVLDSIMATLLYYALAYLLVRIGVRFVLLEERSIMPAFFLVLMVMALPSTLHVSPLLPASLFYLFSMSMLFDINDNKGPQLGIFNAMMVLSLGCLFSLKLLWFIPLIWITVLTMKSLKWRELAHTFVAPGLMFLFLFTWYWGVMDNPEGFTRLISQNLSFTQWEKGQHISLYLYYSYFLLLIIIASLFMMQRFQSRKTIVQNIYQVLFFMFIAGIAFFVFIMRLDPVALVYLAFPIGFILANFFHRKRNQWTHEILLWILLGLLVYLKVS